MHLVLKQWSTHCGSRHWLHFFRCFLSSPSCKYIFQEISFTLFQAFLSCKVKLAPYCILCLSDLQRGWMWIAGWWVIDGGRDETKPFCYLRKIIEIWIDFIPKQQKLHWQTSSVEIIERLEECKCIPRNCLQERTCVGCTLQAHVQVDSKQAHRSALSFFFGKTKLVFAHRQGRGRFNVVGMLRKVNRV